MNAHIGASFLLSSFMVGVTSDYSCCVCDYTAGGAFNVTLSGAAWRAAANYTT